jgi:ATP-dependent DNA helicase DinG
MQLPVRHLFATLATMTELARYPALHASPKALWLEDASGRVSALTRGEALRLSADNPVLLCNAALTGSRIGRADLSGLDVLELFAFVHPAQFCTPTISGLARALRLNPPETAADETALIRRCAAHLLDTCTGAAWRQRGGAYASLQALLRLKWPWAPLLLPVIAAPETSDRGLFQLLPEWEEAAPRPKPLEVRLPDAMVEARLADLTARGAEDRPQQRAYARAVTHGFNPREMESAPNVALAEAGTGTGKTLGYLAPASLWAREARGTVWISTHTKALQRQLDQELNRLYPDPWRKAHACVVRKGRENYACLLNLEEAINGGAAGRGAVFAHLAARWARYSRDGDMIGGDFPAWLMALFRSSYALSLTDRRGECVYSACPHYRRCFIERAQRKTLRADIVVANHALVMVSAARARADVQSMSRIVFDEGHHLFDAADSVFSVHLSGSEMIEMRRWLLGLEGRARGRRRGLEARLSEIVLHDSDIADSLSRLLEAARALPAPEWLARITGDQPHGALEALLAATRAHVLARSDPDEAGYGLEAGLPEPLPVLVSAAEAALRAIDAMIRPMMALESRLSDIKEEAPAWLDHGLRPRLDGALSGLQQRRQTFAAWMALLGSIGGQSDARFVDWASLDRFQGSETDIALCRHWLDPSEPFAKLILEPAQGVVVTSATLRDKTIAEAADWSLADMRTGVQHLALPPQRFSTPSPFDYAHATRIFIVTDVRRGDIAGLAGAYRALIEAAGGGTLGLFTAIARLKAVYARLAPALAQGGLPLYAQHVDPMDTGTLVDIFRAEPHASLIGTDALRDGVDVPGDSLRLVVMEGVPWPRPTILHGHRRAAFGGSGYDDLVTRARLAQAFGRLIRRQSDRGVFVLLGAAVPSRLLSAFPPGAQVSRVSLTEAALETRRFLRDAFEPADMSEAQ